MKKILVTAALAAVLLSTGGCAELEEAMSEAESAAGEAAQGDGKAGKKNREGRRNGRAGNGDGQQGEQRQAAAEPELSTEEQNAVRSAESYIDLSGFSRSGLIEQLEFEGYPTPAATAAVDSLSLNFNEQAGRSAQSYQDMSGFSRQGMIDQLKFEGYTDEQAAAGADAVGL